MSKASVNENTKKSWSQCEFGLDGRLIKGLSKLGLIYPTLIQSKCIPIALQGKDILVKSKTGSGKTFSFALPLINKLLIEKENDSVQNAVRSIILAPTKELCKQIEKSIQSLLYYCRDIISLYCLSEDNESITHFHLQGKPDIIISTPTKIVQQVRNGNLDLSGVKVLVIDEADLLLSFGYNDDLSFITSSLPKIFQGFLVSATLSSQLDKFKKLVLNNPVVVELNESVSTGSLLQFYLESIEVDKYLVLYVFIKLGLLQGKGLIFVNDVNKGYRLKLFLQQFFISAAVLNSELPLNSRVHIIEEHNRGVFDLLIATDSSLDYDDNGDDGNDDNGDDGNVDANSKSDEGKESVDDIGEEEDGGSDVEADGDVENDDITSISHKRKRNLNKSTKATATDEYGVSRGIDFQDVNFVINFDFPVSASSYTHRIGRTARGSKVGTSLSFITKPVNTHSHKVLSQKENNDFKISDRDYKVLKEVRYRQPKLGVSDNDSVLAAIRSIDESIRNKSSGGDTAITAVDTIDNLSQPVPLNFNMKELDSFRYRVEDTLRSVTNVAVKELRTAEIKREILNSTKLKNYFSENPNDLTVLRHDKAILHPIVQKSHLKAVPNYLIPNSMKAVANIQTKKSKKRKTNVKGQPAESRIMKSKKNDPLYQPMESSSNEADNGQYDETDGNDNLSGEQLYTEVEGDHSKAYDDDDGNNNENGDDEDGGVQDNNNSERLYSIKESSNLGRSSAGRREWQLRHKKGKFNEKQLKKLSHRTPGTFLKSKKIK